VADPPLPMLQASAGALAARLGLPVARDALDASELLLVCTPERIELRDPRTPRVGPVYVDFGATIPSGAALSRRQPLARALGKRSRTVIDATAGWGGDAFLLACLGFEVTAMERNAVVVALLEDGLTRALRNAHLAQALGGRLRIVHGDARALLPALDPRPDAVFIDPMFPPKRKSSAAVRKEMRLLRLLVGDDADAAELLAVSRACARERVIVKRPDDAAPLAARPATTYRGKLVRYDVYPVARQ
jgi:16S rRNA (guanine1516-N2)-methyltransferase